MGTEGEAVHHLWGVLLPGVLLPFVLASAPPLRLTALAFPRLPHIQSLWKTSEQITIWIHIYLRHKFYFYDRDAAVALQLAKYLSKHIPCSKIDTYQQKRLLRENRNVDTSTRTESWRLSTLKLLRNMLTKIIETHKVRLALFNKEDCWKMLTKTFRIQEVDPGSTTGSTQFIW
jgi:hypothetical protein